MMPPGTQLAAREPTYPTYPNLSGDSESWWTTHRNWHICKGKEDKYGRVPVDAVLCEHDADDSPDRAFWASSLEDAIARIDAMPNYGDVSSDYSYMGKVEDC